MDTKFIQRIVVLTTAVTFVAACSGSGDDSSSLAPVNVIDNFGSSDAAVDDAPQLAETETIETPVIEAGVSEPLVTEPEVSEPVVTEPEVPEPVVTEPEVPEPEPETRISQVNFSITVPAYQSNGLQVRLLWGDVDTNAQWMGDELWEVFAELPVDTENLLNITFYDNNGDLELASFEQTYKTGFNDAESYSVSVDQFDSDRWDADGDGVSNLAELIAGTDPLVDEDSLLEIRDSVLQSFSFVESTFEARITEERPYFEFSEVFRQPRENGPPTGEDRTIEINIDATGNGTISESYQSGFGTWLIGGGLEGTRTRSDSSIMWDARQSDYEDPINLSITTTSLYEVSVVDDQTFQYEEDYRYFYNASDAGTNSENTREIDLIGTHIEGTSNCQPVSGSITRVSSSGGPDAIVERSTTTTITKGVDDMFWRVVSVSESTDTDPEETEYFAREIDSAFQCQFSDL